jgi:hypothetical protein
MVRATEDKHPNNGTHCHLYMNTVPVSFDLDVLNIMRNGSDKQSPLTDIKDMTFVLPPSLPQFKCSLCPANRSNQILLLSISCTQTGSEVQKYMDILWRTEPLLNGDCKQQPLLSNALYIHASNNRTVMRPVSTCRIGKCASTTHCWKRCFLFGRCKVVMCLQL